MYIPGRLRTASRPSRTVISLALYEAVEASATDAFRVRAKPTATTSVITTPQGEPQLAKLAKCEAETTQKRRDFSEIILSLGCDNFGLIGPAIARSGIAKNWLKIAAIDARFVRLRLRPHRGRYSSVRPAATCCRHWSVPWSTPDCRAHCAAAPDWTLALAMVSNPASSSGAVRSLHQASGLARFTPGVTPHTPEPCRAP